MNSQLYKICCFSIIVLTACSNEQEFKAEKASVAESRTIKKAVEAKSHRVNTEKSVIRWKGTKMLRTAGHEGTVALKEGFLLFSNGFLVGGKITADMNTIKINSKDGDMVNLSNHLKKKEFNATRYPLASFEITNVKYLGGDSLRVWGNMSIKDVTKNISIPAFIGSSGDSAKRFRTKFSLERAVWNIGSDGNLLEKNLVDKDFELRIELEAGE